MTPLGHISINYLTGKISKKINIMAMVTGALIPDIDWLLFFIPSFNSIHRSVTHNLLFVIVISFMVSLFLRKKKKEIFISLIIGQILHLFFDSIIDTNISNGIGIQILWPFHPLFFSPFNLARVSNELTGWDDPISMIKKNLPYLIIELPFIIIAVYLLIKQKSKGFKNACNEKN